MVAVAASEAVPVPGLVLVRHAAAGDNLEKTSSLNSESTLFCKSFLTCDSFDINLLYLVALDASGSELILVAAGAVDLLLAGYEALGADRVLAHDAAETLLVPLSRLVLHLLRACNYFIVNFLSISRYRFYYLDNIFGSSIGCFFMANLFVIYNILYVEF